jgi:hypothetical protein
LTVAVQHAEALPVWARTIVTLIALSLTAAGSVTLLVLTLRASILFPAIAVDAAGVTWRNAMDDSRHHAGHIFVLLVVASIPFLLATIVILRMKAVMDSLSGALLALALTDIALVAYTAMAVALASRLYLALGDRLNQVREPA